MRPAVFLYEEPTTEADAEMIHEFATADAEKKPDLLLVMGTSLSIPSFRKLIASVSAGLSHRCKILINSTPISQTDVEFGYFVQSKVEDWVDAVVDRWKPETGLCTCKPYSTTGDCSHREDMDIGPGFKLGPVPKTYGEYCDLDL